MQGGGAGSQSEGQTDSALRRVSSGDCLGADAQLPEEATPPLMGQKHRGRREELARGPDRGPRPHGKWVSQAL